MPPLAQAHRPFHRAIEIRCCRNIDEQATLLGAWNQSYCQLSRGAFDGSLSSVTVGGVRLLVERLNRTLYQRGQVARNKVAVGIPFQLEGHALLCGQISHREALHVFSGEGGFEFLSPDRHVIVNLEIDSAQITNEAVRAQFSEILPSLGTRPGVRNVDPLRMQRLRALLKQLLDSVMEAPALLEDPAIGASFEKAVVFGLVEALHRSAPDEPRAPAEARMARQWQMVRSAREHIEDAGDHPISVAELCMHFRASRRTMQYAFQATLGIQPSAYMRAVRLGQVRRSLRDANSVTEVATRWGFWHLGNFSSEYRDQFGELPSETFRRLRGG